MKKITFLAVLLSLFACERNTENVAVNRLEIENGHYFLLSSRNVGDTFKISVVLPPDYHESDISYPVLYALDANRSFPAVQNIATILSYPGRRSIPEMIVVGIGYPTDQLSYYPKRSRDLTPTRDTVSEKQMTKIYSQLKGESHTVITGNGSSLLRFVNNELIPEVNKRYRTDSLRILGGYSHGGLFALFTLFNSPSSFQKYIIGSPSVYWDDGVILSSEVDYFESNNDLHADIFMSFGSRENEYARQSMVQLSDSLRSRKYPNLSLQTKILEGEDHMTNVFTTYSRGIKSVMSMRK